MKNRKHGSSFRGENPSASSSRWHSINLKKDGVEYIFEINLSNRYMNKVKLKHVRFADRKRDEWVELPSRSIDKFRNDPELMATLTDKVEFLELGRVLDDDSPEDEGDCSGSEIQPE